MKIALISQFLSGHVCVFGEPEIGIGFSLSLDDISLC